MFVWTSRKELKDTHGLLTMVTMELGFDWHDGGEGEKCDF